MKKLTTWLIAIIMTVSAVSLPVISLADTAAQAPATQSAQILSEGAAEAPQEDAEELHPREDDAIGTPVAEDNDNHQPEGKNTSTPAATNTAVLNAAEDVSALGGEVTPGGEATPSNEPTPGGEATPSNEPTPGGEATPSNEPTPGGEATPSNEPTPGGEATPSNEPTPGGEATPSNEPTPVQEPTSRPKTSESEFEIVKVTGLNGIAGGKSAIKLDLLYNGPEYKTNALKMSISDENTDGNQRPASIFKYLTIEYEGYQLQINNPNFPFVKSFPRILIDQRNGDPKIDYLFVNNILFDDDIKTQQQGLEEKDYQLMFRVRYILMDDPAGEEKVSEVIVKSGDKNQPIYYSVTFPPESTQQPDATLEPDDTYPPVAAGNFEVGPFGIPSAKAGSKFTITFPVAYRDNVEYISSDANGEFNKNLKEHVSYLAVQLDITDINSLPFNVESVHKPFVLYDEEKGTQRPTFSQTYTALKTPVAGNATYSVPYKVFYTMADGSQGTATIIIPVKITGVSTGGSGGSSGGGGGSSLKSLPRLMITSVSAQPQIPLAGEEFDLVIEMLNTSEQQKVKNIKITAEAADNAFIPVSNASSLFIPSIGKGEEHTVTFRMRTMADMPDGLVQTTITIDYEDEKTASLQTTETFPVQVSQTPRAKIDDPVPPADAMINNISTMQMLFANTGRTMLYNVMAEITLNDTVQPILSWFGGNMEPGASKTIELEFIPLSEFVEGEIIITYENSQGEVSEPIVKPFSFYAMNDPYADFMYDDMGYEDEFGDDYYMEYDEFGNPIDPELPQEDAQSNIFDKLSEIEWYYYAGAGMAISLLILIIILAAAKRRRKVQAEYEME